MPKSDDIVTNVRKMADPIEEDIQWLLRELKQVNDDLIVANGYYSMIERGNTVSMRYSLFDEESEISWNLRGYVIDQIKILNNAREAILFELECLDESYLDNLIS